MPKTTLAIKKSVVDRQAILAQNELAMEVDYIIERLNTEYVRLLDSNLTPRQSARQVVRMVRKKTGFYKTFHNKIDGITGEISKQAVHKPLLLIAKDRPLQKFIWVLGSVKTNHCPDCLNLSGKSARTVKAWREQGFGLPREGGTQCNVGCQCMLQPIAEEIAPLKGQSSFVKLRGTYKGQHPIPTFAKAGR